MRTLRAWWLVPGLGICALDATLAARPLLGGQRAAGGEHARAGRVVASHLETARRLDRDPKSVPDAQLVAAYAGWAGDAADLRARRVLLRGLLRAGGGPLGVDTLLTAVQADPTPAERDALWSELVERLADRLEQGPRRPGLDLMVSETRPRARRALFSAFALLVTSERAERFDADARQTLIDNFIDGWNGLPEAQRPEVEQALRKLAGNDVADIMNGQGLATDDALEGTRERERVLEQTAQNLGVR